MPSPLVDAILPSAAAAAGVVLADITELFIIRISDDTDDQLVGQLDDAGRLWADQPHVVEVLQESRSAFLADGGDDAKTAVGWWRIAHDALGGDKPNGGLLGWARFAEASGTDKPALLMVFDTTGAERDHKRRDGTTANAFGVAVQQTLAAMPLVWRTSLLRYDRASRNPEVFHALNGTMAERPGAKLRVGDEEVDPANPDIGSSLKAQQAAEAGRDLKTNTSKGTLNRLRSSNAWPLREEHLPVGLQFEREVDASGQAVVRNKCRPVVDPVGAACAKAVLAGLHDGHALLRIGVDAALTGARDGNGRLLALQMTSGMTATDRERLRHELLPTLPEAEQHAVLSRLEGTDPSLSRAAAGRAAGRYVRRISSRMDFYRTGHLDWVWLAALPGVSDYLGHRPLWPVHSDTDLEQIEDGDRLVLADLPRFHPYFQHDAAWQAKTRIKGVHIGRCEWESPVDLPDDVWTKLEDRRDKHPGLFRRAEAAPHADDRDAGRARASTAPLSGLTWVDGTTDDGRTQRWSLTTSGGAYELWAGPNDGGRPWYERRTSVARLQATSAHRSLARSLVETLDAMAVDSSVPTPLVTTCRPHVDEPSPAELRTAALAGAERRVTDQRRRLRNLIEDRADEERGSEDWKLADELVTKARAELSALETELEQLQAAPAPHHHEGPADDDMTRVLDVSDHGVTLVDVTIALARLVDRGDVGNDPLLQATIRSLFDDGRLLRVVEVTDTYVTLDVAVRLVSDDGPPVELPIGPVQVTRTNRISEPTTGYPSLIDEAAARLLREQDTTTFLVRTGWDGPYLVEAVRSWLDDRDVPPGARNALIDAALHDRHWPAPTVVHHWLTTDTPPDRRTAAAAAAADVEPWLVRRLVQTYLGDHATHWPKAGTGQVRNPLTDLRALVALLAVQDGPVDRGDVAHTLGITRRQLSDLTDARNRLDTSTRDPLHPRAYWLNRTATTVALPRCDTRTCERYGTPVDVILAMPETLLHDDPQPLVCGSCHTAPGSDHTWPSPYTDGDWDTAGSLSDLGDGTTSIVLAPARPTPTRRLPPAQPHTTTDTQHLTCSNGDDCIRPDGPNWTRPGTPGRPPARCPDCTNTPPTTAATTRTMTGTCAHCGVDFTWQVKQRARQRNYCDPHRTRHGRRASG